MPYSKKWIQSTQPVCWCTWNSWLSKIKTWVQSAIVNLTLAACDTLNAKKETLQKPSGTLTSVFFLIEPKETEGHLKQTSSTRLQHKLAAPTGATNTAKHKPDRIQVAEPNLLSCRHQVYSGGMMFSSHQGTRQPSACIFKRRGCKKTSETLAWMIPGTRSSIPRCFLLNHAVAQLLRN